MTPPLRNAGTASSRHPGQFTRDPEDVDTPPAATTPGTQWLFSYGTLRDPAVQEATFGRVVTGHPDSLPGFTVQALRITDPDVLALSGAEYHPILTPSDNPGDCVAGTVLAITVSELKAADSYEVDDYARVSLELTSGLQAWVYLSADQHLRHQFAD